MTNLSLFFISLVEESHLNLTITVDLLKFHSSLFIIFCLDSPLHQFFFMLPGLTPLITNEVGMFVETTFNDLREDQLRNGVAGSTKVKLHRLNTRGSKSADYSSCGGGGSARLQDSSGSAKVAFPNDRAKSIRPFDRKEKFQ